jgi:phage terminase small subunit
MTASDLFSRRNSFYKFLGGALMGRNAKPAALHIAEGNPNRLTKEEIANRQKAEIKLGMNELSKLKPPAFVKNDEVALRHWKQHIKEYKGASDQGVDLLTSSDVGMLALYCKTYSEYERLLNAYQRIDNIASDSEPLEDYLDSSEEFGYKARQQITNLLSIDGLLRIETAINKKMDMLIKMQDRLFLNPLAKVKNVPKPKKEEKKVSKFGKFGAGRGG